MAPHLAAECWSILLAPPAETASALQRVRHTSPAAGAVLSPDVHAVPWPVADPQVLESQVPQDEHVLVQLQGQKVGSVSVTPADLAAPAALEAAVRASELFRQHVGTAPVSKVVVVLKRKLINFVRA